MGRKLITATCEYCGKEFERRRTLRPGIGRFCSRECGYASHIRAELRTCVICDNQFSTYPSNASATCSKECSQIFRAQTAKHNLSLTDRLANARKSVETRRERGNLGGHRNPREEKTCLQCGKSFVVAPLNKKGGQKRFCSTTCWRDYSSEHPTATSGFKGGIFTRFFGTYWQKQAAKARERDNYTCQRCGKLQVNPQMPVHHIIPRRMFKTSREAHRLENLVTLCRSCHRKVEWEQKS